jgi:EAL domain-containing protein (putative c-di-GMP-specific phosphodiesterase class I)
MALARYWEWERTVRREMPNVITGTGIETVFQPIYRIDRGVPAALGFEALSRFTDAPRIPLGLWFRTAKEMGLRAELEMAAIRTAFHNTDRVPRAAFVCVNASPEIAATLSEVIPDELQGRLMVDIPFAGIGEAVSGEAIEILHGAGAGVAIDDVPLEDLHQLRSELVALGPDCVKVDVVTGLAGSPMGRFNLAEGASWCQESSITLIAERVERVSDLAVLEAVGVEWAQGYTLSSPLDLREP